MGEQLSIGESQTAAPAKKRGGKPRLGTEPVNGFLTRTQVARALGITISGVRRLEGTKIPVHNRDGVHLFDARDVETFRVRRTVKGPMPEGLAAAEVFALIDDNVRAVDIVKRLQIHPDVVEALARQHARMCGAVLLEPVQLEELTRIAKVGPAPRTAGDVLGLMRAAVESSHACAACKSDAARFCADCSPTRAPKSGARTQRG